MLAVPGFAPEHGPTRSTRSRRARRRIRCATGFELSGLGGCDIGRRQHDAAPGRPMTAEADDLRQRLAAVRRTIDAACARAGRSPDSVRLVAVGKTFSADAVGRAVAAGITDVGENYVQEGRAKQLEVGRGRATWHLIGGLQRNKVRIAAEVFDWIHTLDDVALAVALDRAVAPLGRRPRVLLQVNVAGEGTKRGVRPGDAATIAEAVVRLPSLDLCGLMTVPPYADDPETARPWFRALRSLRDDVARRLGHALPELSMGMSGDFATAIEEGATLVRVGRALFGPRPTRAGLRPAQ
jgi:pyridoxal phosphate enzyme (YggS family)